MVRKILQEAAQKLSSSDSPLLDARILLAYAMGVENAALIFDVPTEKQLSVFEKYIEQRKAGTPVAYILGKKEFMGFTFQLNNATLIPRPDTECLVEKVIEKNHVKAPKILDLCTGSGCIGISLAMLIENADITLVDISEDALCAADKNIKEHNLSARVRTQRLDILNEELYGNYDIIVSNPPYIKSDIISSLDVSKSEPVLALDGGIDGLDFYKSIVKKAFSHLNNGGLLALEIGYDQGETVPALMTDFTGVEVSKDYGGNDRVVCGRKKMNISK